MKFKKVLALSTASLLALGLAACGGEETTSQPTTSNTFDAEAKLATFAKSIGKTVVATYTNTVKVDVDANGGEANLDSFKRNIDSTTKIELDLQNEYLYIKRDRKDKNVSDVTKTDEVILYKAADGSYKSESNKYDVKSEEVTSFLTTANTFIKKYTQENYGNLSVSSFLYNSSNLAYEYDMAAYDEDMRTDVSTELSTSTYKENSNKGIDVSANLEYVGYVGDTGSVFAMGGKDGKPAGTLDLSTNNEGYVTKLSETYNTSLSMAIMEPNPIVLVTGTRGFTASYGDAITKKTEIAKLDRVANYPATVSNGTYEVYTMKPNDPTSSKPLANGATIGEGLQIVVKPTAAKGYVVDSVKVNGVAAQLSGGIFYVIDAVYGDNDIVVKFKVDAPRQVKYTYTGTLNGQNGQVNVELMLYDDNSFEFKAPAFNNAVVGKGTYNMSQSMVKLTLDPVKITGMSDITEAEQVLDLSATYALSASSFFGNAQAVTFSPKKAS